VTLGRSGTLSRLVESIANGRMGDARTMRGFMGPVADLERDGPTDGR
jgi:hypothetical protein